MFLQNQHFIRKGFLLILLFQISVEVGVGVFDEHLFRYWTSLREPGKAAEAHSHGVRHSARREVQNIESGSCSFHSFPDVFLELLGDVVQVNLLFQASVYPFTFCSFCLLSLS